MGGAAERQGSLIGVPNSILLTITIISSFCGVGCSEDASGRSRVAHLLLVESWVGAMGTLLPRAIADLGVEFTFLTRRPEHYPDALPDGSPHPLRSGRAVVTAETRRPLSKDRNGNPHNVRTNHAVVTAAPGSDPRATY